MEADHPYYDMMSRLISCLSLLFYRQSRSHLGAAAVLATQIRLVCSAGGSDFSLEVEGDGDDDDGT